MNDSLELFLKISFFQPGVQFSPISSMFFIPMISIIILMFFCYPCDHYIIIHILNQLVLMEQVCQLCRNVWIVCKGSFIFAVECGALCKQPEFQSLIREHLTGGEFNSVLYPVFFLFPLSVVILSSFCYTHDH